MSLTPREQEEVEMMMGMMRQEFLDWRWRVPCVKSAMTGGA